ncbi:hypothetical protein PILCRDRAFT_736132 [Piloderma croceum F 1598]|uniref:Uncharacterized protein n=1 Tax=Piloderma croceum (strain F 1598) TaxID=765440 RepID=A0A0C3AGG7_PILCF|nr:hypothetical protein PILCRDRAFT_736132 [Piloderma croceum F 1598]
MQSAQGFIYHLSRVEENALRAAVEPNVTAWRNDSQLSTKLITKEEYSSTFPSLFSACQSMQSMLWPSEPKLSMERSGLYNTATCFEFHQLLVSTLVNYGKALEKLAGAHTTYSKQQNEQNLAKMAEYAKNVWEYGQVLWAIAYSRILEDHLGVLRKSGWLPLPVNEKTELDRSSGFTGFKRKPTVIANPPSVVKDGADRDGGDAVEGYRDEAGQGGGDTVKGGEGGAGQDDEDGVEGGNEAILIINNALRSDDKNFAVVYLDWIRLQVDRWQAPRKITSFVRRIATQDTIDLNLLAARHPQPMHIHEAMEPWDRTIKDLYARIADIEKADDVIRVLKDIIDRQQSERTDGVPQSIFRKFDPSPRAENHQFQATVHCEAVLAALAKFPSRAVGDSTLRECLQDIDISSIAVSKPCCPVCWELFSTLRDDNSPDFCVGGHHQTLFQVELPSWLPLKVVETLTHKFEGYLLSQITILMKSHGRHAINPSGQSAHDFSSDSSDGEKDQSSGLLYNADDLTPLRLVMAKRSLERQERRGRRGRRTTDTHSSSGPK